MDILYIVMPAYNEEANILRVVDSWYQLLEGKDPASRLVVADSGSTDATHNILTKYSSRHPQMEILEKTEKQHGPKVIALYDHAIKNAVIHAVINRPGALLISVSPKKIFQAVKADQLKACLNRRQIDLIHQGAAHPVMYSRNTKP